MVQMLDRQLEWGIWIQAASGGGAGLLHVRGDHPRRGSREAKNRHWYFSVDLKKENQQKKCQRSYFFSRDGRWAWGGVGKREGGMRDARQRQSNRNTEGKPLGVCGSKTCQGRRLNFFF